MPRLPRSICFLLVSGFTLLGFSVASAGPWTRDAGQAYVKLSQGGFMADEFVDAQGNVVGGTEYMGLTSALYAEVGLFDDLHLVLFVPYSVGTNTFEGLGRFRSARIGDVTGGLQWSSPWLNIPHAIRGEVKVPFYDAGEPGGRDAERFPLIGDGQVDYTLWLSIGDSIPGTPLYAFVDVGQRWRTETFVGEGLDRGFVDSFVAMSQVGWTVWRDIILAGNLQVVRPWEQDNSTKGYVTAGPSLFAPIGGGFAFEAAYDATLQARNSANGTAWTVGFSWSQN